jgi:hypothetical protein
MAVAVLAVPEELAQASKLTLRGLVQPRETA